MSPTARNVIIAGGYDNLRSTHVRFLEEAHRLGSVYVFLWSDSLFEAFTGQPPIFSQAERLYMMQSIRYVDNVRVISSMPDQDSLPRPVWDELSTADFPAVWVVEQGHDSLLKRLFCASMSLGYQVIPEINLEGFPDLRYDGLDEPSGHKKVIVSGCYDWLHSGHVRFFEEVAELGDLYVVVGSDVNVSLLKGAGHPMFDEQERRYMVQAIRFVKAALISSGHGWMDAEPEIELIRPDIYAVNEDGDKPEKRRYCAAHGLEYVVLKRQPRPGLPRRESTILRGF
jgi:cytidyltransferase-like protein